MTSWAEPGGLRTRVHGERGPAVIVLHGGPAAAGGARLLAAGLADRFRVYEPLQRGSGDEPLTVARHVADLHALIADTGAERPALVGESWGAMLALAYAAAHPDQVGPLALIGCGTWDEGARGVLRATLAERHVERHGLAVYDFDAEPDPPDPDAPPFDERAHLETWEDMVRCQRAGLYPAAFAAIRGPVKMFHGDFDPHPGALVRDSLLAVLPQLEYQSWVECGHSPWRERRVREEFRVALREWLDRGGLDRASAAR